MIAEYKLPEIVEIRNMKLTRQLHIVHRKEKVKNK